MVAVSGYLVQRLMAADEADYLRGWDAEFGVDCTSRADRALRFIERADAEDAAAKARSVARGYGGAPLGAAFGVVEG